MPIIPVTRSQVRLMADPTRFITKPYVAADQNPDEDRSRAGRLVDRILGLSPSEAVATLAELRRTFDHRHPDLDRVFLRGFSAVASTVAGAAELPADMQLLIGAYVMHEYAIEGAALTNPSIVPHPDQAHVPDGSLRVIVSVRAVGEGHISAIEFRTGTVDSVGDIDLEAPGTPLTGDHTRPTFAKAAFTSRLEEMGGLAGPVQRLLGDLENRFTMADLDRESEGLRRREEHSEQVESAIRSLHWLASSNYEVDFPAGSIISQRVLFPSGPTESHGMEDARFVRFVEADGSARYYATYTAYDGFRVLPQLIETSDFQSFRIATLSGREARNKGMALFPRPVGGQYMALGRSDGESNFLMRSDDIRFWDESKRIQVSMHPWDLMQIGNAGSPIETEAGWLVVTHGVGPMRRYTLGALLLDLDEPERVIGSLAEPLLEPNEEERDGYVPNVVYSCGSLIHRGRLVIAYGASDTITSFATVPVDRLLAELTRGPHRTP
jgi:predicted GH43/DUF377 family glycosyl hydrolase